MLRHILFDVSFFENESDRSNSQKRVLFLLHALTNCNRLYLREHPDTPLIYKSGITYKVPAQFEQEDVPEVGKVVKFLKSIGAPSDVMSAMTQLSRMCGGGEHFREIPRIIENGGGDCDNVACWRAAELCERLGIFAQPYITWRTRADGGTTYHVIVRYPDGSSEDPSLLLGMGGADRAPDRQEEERKLGERTADFINVLAQNRGNVRKAVDQVLGCDAPKKDGSLLETIFSGQTESNFGKGIQYTIPFQTDDSYESWSPTRPQAFYADPRYPGMPSGPFINTRWRDADDVEDDFDDRMDGDLKALDIKPSLRRRLRHALRNDVRIFGE